MCSADQYFDGVECKQCHETCFDGCTDGNKCEFYECHESCQTCTGPDAADCLTCYCNAQRTDPTTLASCCECNAGYNGEPHDCVNSTCEDRGCELCVDDEDEHSCIRCKENYEFVFTTDETHGYCHYCVGDDFYPYDTCGARNASGLNNEGYNGGD